MQTTSTTTPPEFQSPGGASGREASSPAQVPAAGWKEIAKRTWGESSKDNVGLIAAGVAFYAFLALVPLLGAIVLTYGLVADPATVARQAGSLTEMLPGEVAQVVGDQLRNVAQTSGGKKGFGLVLALLIALWGARSAASAIVTALNIAYEEEEDRGFIKTTLLALAMTVGAVLLALLAGGAIAMLGFLHHLFPDTGPVAAFLWKLVTYALLGAVAAAAAATLYRYGPARDDAKWRWLTPGSIFFAVGWLLLTLGFGFYVSNFGNYGATYGSLSAIVVLLTWLYLSSYVLLFGAEFNSEIEHQTAEDTTAGEDKPLGTRGAWSADHVAAGSDQGGTNEEGGASEPAAVAAGHSGQAHPRPIRQAGEGKGKEHPYLASRASARAGKMAGGAKVSMLASVLSTLGLSMLRRKGKAGAGAALLGTAAGLAFLRRK